MRRRCCHGERLLPSYVQSDLRPYCCYFLLRLLRGLGTVRPHIQPEFDTAAGAIGSFANFRFAFREACDEILVEPASVFDDVAALVVELFGVRLDESYSLLEVGPLGVLAEGNFFLDHVQRDGRLNDAEIVAVELFTGEVEEVVGHKLASGGEE